MIKEAQKVLEKSEKNESIATALFTEKGNIFVTCCNTFSNCTCCSQKLEDNYSIHNDLIATEKKRVLKMVTVYKKGETIGIEVPCAWLRQFIYDMNNDNMNTEVGMGSGKIHLLKEFFVK